MVGPSAMGSVKGAPSSRTSAAIISTSSDSSSICFAPRLTSSSPLHGQQDAGRIFRSRVSRSHIRDQRRLQVLKIQCQQMPSSHHPTMIPRGKSVIARDGKRSTNPALRLAALKGLLDGFHDASYRLCVASSIQFTQVDIESKSAVAKGIDGGFKEETILMPAARFPEECGPPLHLPLRQALRD